MRSLVEIRQDDPRNHTKQHEIIFVQFRVTSWIVFYESRTMTLPAAGAQVPSLNGSLLWPVCADWEGIILSCWKAVARSCRCRDCGCRGRRKCRKFLPASVW